jgi:hypothetical protein
MTFCHHKSQLLYLLYRKKVQILRLNTVTGAGGHHTFVLRFITGDFCVQKSNYMKVLLFCRHSGYARIMPTRLSLCPNPSEYVALRAI